MKVNELIVELNKFELTDTVFILKDRNTAYIMTEEDNKLAITVPCDGWIGDMDGEDGQIVELF